MRYGDIDNPITIDTTWQLVEDSGELQSLDANTKLFIRGDTIADASGKTVTANGTAAVTTSQYKFDQIWSSISLDGNSDYLTLSDTDDFYFSADFTIDFWVRFDTLQDCTFWYQRTDGSNYISAFYQYSPTSRLRFEVFSGGGAVVELIRNWTPSVDTWYHIALVRDGNDWDWYVDGVQQGSSLTDTSSPANYTGTIYVGSNQGTSSYIYGFISAFRVTNGTALWSTDFTVPSYSDYKGAITDYHFANLDGDTDEEYFLITRFVAGAGNIGYTLRPNNLTTNQGYQRMQGSNSTAGALRGTYLIRIGTIDGAGSAGDLSFGRCHIYAKSGKERTFLCLNNEGYFNGGTTVNAIGQYGCSWNETTTNITSLVTHSDITNGIGVGSRMILMKKQTVSSGLKTGKIEPVGNIYGVWQKVYENELSSAATSVTISDLDGNSDVLYRIMIRLRSNNASAVAVSIRPNNDSGSNYGYQILQGASTSVSAARGTGQSNMWALYGGTTTGNLALGEGILYAKSGYERTMIAKDVSEISGTTVTRTTLNAEVWNDTSSNITSLVILASQSSGLGIGTHIELWKLNL